MPALSNTWSTKTVTITYRNPLTLVKETGSWVLETTGRVTNTLANGKKQVFRPGKIASGALNTVDDGVTPSLSVDLPVVDDPDNTPQGGVIKLTISFNSGGGEVFSLMPLSSWQSVTDIGDVLDVAITPSAPTYVIKGVAGGVAALDADGDVVNSAGVKVIAGGGGITNITMALVPAGMSYKVLWNDTTKKWYYNGNEINARLSNRTDLYIDFIGGRETDRPGWGQINGDTQEVTIV